MRILMLSPSPNIRGPIPKHTPYLVNALRDLGCEVATLSWGKHRDRESLREKFTGRAQDIRRVQTELQRTSYDVLVIKTAHDWATLSRDLPLLLATRRLCPCSVLQFHGSWAERLVGSDNRLFKLGTHLLLKLSDAGLLLSCEEQEQWQSFYPQGKFYTVRNPYVPLQTSQNIPMQSAQMPNLPSDIPILLFTGRLIEAKGVFELLDALPLVLSQLMCHLHIVGDGPHIQQMQARAEQLGIVEHVTFGGYLEGAALTTAYRCADVLVLPSWSEGFPTSITDAMQAGLPIVTTRIRGMADHLEEGVHAVFVPIRDPVALADTLTRLLRDKALCASMAQANLEKVQQFAPQAVGQQYLNVLNNIMMTRQQAKRRF